VILSPMSLMSLSSASSISSPRASSASTFIAMATLAAALILGACKQGAGERCQVNDDSADGLTCSQAEPKICGGSDVEQIDAEVPPQQEAGVMDAAVDAAIDAAIDAPPDPMAPAAP